MKVSPIIFSGAMVRALLEGRKVQTRRLAWKPWPEGEPIPPHGANPKETPWQRIQPGDLLWVRENFRLRADQDGKPPSEDWWKAGAWYQASDPLLTPSGCAGGAGKLRPCIHMPRWASRLTLRITDVSMQSLAEINREDAIAEGMCENAEGFWFTEPGHKLPFARTPQQGFKVLWNTLHGLGSFEENPDVVVLQFEVIRQNVDAYLRQMIDFGIKKLEARGEIERTLREELKASDK